MNLTQLEYFRTLAQMEHVTRAAEQLCITQSTLSKTILALETELGYSLFEHRRGVIRLNDRGRRFLVGVENAFLCISEAVAAGGDDGEKVQDMLRITSPHPYSHSYTGNVIGEFLTDYPDVQIVHEISNNFYDMMGKLHSAQVDCVIAMEGMTTDSRITWQKVCVEPIVFVVRKEDAGVLHMRESVQRFADWNFCLSAPDTDQRRLEAGILEQAGVAPNIVYEGTDQPYVIGHIKLENVVAMIPSSGAEMIPPGSGVVVIQAEESFCNFNLGVYYLKDNRNQCLQQLIRHMQKRMLNSTRPIR